MSPVRGHPPFSAFPHSPTRLAPSKACRDLLPQAGAALLLSSFRSCYPPSLPIRSPRAMAHGRRELAAFPIQASEASQTRWSRGLAVAPKDEHGSPTRRKRNVMEWSGGAAGQWRCLLRRTPSHYCDEHFGWIRVPGLPALARWANESTQCTNQGALRKAVGPPDPFTEWWEHRETWSYDLESIQGKKTCRDATSCSTNKYIHAVTQ